jgi:hypothetical protein
MYAQDGRFRLRAEAVLRRTGVPSRRRVGEERQHQFLEALGLTHVHDVIGALDDDLPRPGSL